MLDEAWLQSNPLPDLNGIKGKDDRGCVLIVGGAKFVPGALRLTGEAALRAGAGKIQLATVAEAAIALGVLMPEAAMLALTADEHGEIAPEAANVLKDRLQRCDALVLGPGMSIGENTDRLIADMLSAPVESRSILLDAAAITVASKLKADIRRHEGRIIMTPHHGEMALLAGTTEEAVAADPEGYARKMAKRYRAIILIKGKNSMIAAADGTLLNFEGGCVGLGTAGSGDVLSGIIGGLSARGADPLTATAWGCWLHGKAGELLSREIGTVGFIASDLLPIIPRLMEQYKD